MNALHLERGHSQSEARIRVLDLGHDEVLDGDIVLCHQICGILLLVDERSRLNGLGAFQDDGPGQSC